MKLGSGITLTLALVSGGCSPGVRNEQQQAAADGINVIAPVAATKRTGNGPFGVEQGQPLEQLGKSKQTAPGFYELSSVDAPYPNVETYVVQNTPSFGTCMIKAISNNITADSYGNNIRQALDSVKDDLSTRYGAPDTSFDFLHSGSIWNEPNDWTMGLAKEERTYAYFWKTPKDARVSVWRHVRTIGLIAASDGSKSWWSLEYDFDNGDNCDSDLKKQAAKSL